MCAILAYAGGPPSVVDVFAGMAAALSQGNAAAFLKPINPAMPDYAKLQAEVYALVQQADVGSSVEVLRDEGNERQRSVDLDWILEVTGKASASPTERRHQTVKCRLELRDKTWKIVLLEPVGFFGPPQM